MAGIKLCIDVRNTIVFFILRMSNTIEVRRIFFERIIAMHNEKE